MLRLERDAWSMVKGLRLATNEYAPFLLRPEMNEWSMVKRTEASNE